MPKAKDRLPLIGKDLPLIGKEMSGDLIGWVVLGLVVLLVAILAWLMALHVPALWNGA